MKYSLILAVFLLLLSSPAVAEEPLDGWFSRSTSARAYVSIRGELASILAEAGEREIPVDLMLARLTEGAEKRIAPDKLVLALKKDLDIYAFVLAVVSKTYPNASSPRERLDLLGLGGLCLRSGMDEGSFGKVMAATAASKAGPRRTIDALVAVAALSSRMPLDASSMENLSVSLALSSEKAERFSLLSSLFLRGKAGKIGARDLVGLAVSVLDSGGGFLQLENEITRRIK